MITKFLQFSTAKNRSTKIVLLVSKDILFIGEIELVGEEEELQYM